MTTNIPINPIGNYRKDKTEVLRCPRCQESLLPIGYPGALSRRDNKTELCPQCGFEEAIRDLSRSRWTEPQEVSK